MRLGIFLCGMLGEQERAEHVLAKRVKLARPYRLLIGDTFTNPPRFPWTPEYAPIVRTNRFRYHSFNRSCLLTDCCPQTCRSHYLSVSQDRTATRISLPCLIVVGVTVRRVRVVLPKTDIKLQSGKKTSITGRKSHQEHQESATRRQPNWHDMGPHSAYGSFLLMPSQHCAMLEISVARLFSTHTDWFAVWRIPARRESTLCTTAKHRRGPVARKRPLLHLKICLDFLQLYSVLMFA